MPSTTLLLVLLSPVILFSLWHISVTVAQPPIPSSLKNKRIILLIAHPDDESMFFSPALQALTDPALGNHLKILCMSTGDADGLGDTRRKELQSAALTLGLRQPGDVFVMDDERFKDGMGEVWEERDIARVLAQAFAPQLVAPTTQSNTTSEKDKSAKEKTTKHSTKSSTSSIKASTSKTKSSSSSSKSSTPAATPPPTPQTQEGPRATIDVLVTFDASGVSSHPNHISLYHGSRLFLRHIMKDHPGYRCPVSLYTLSTVNLPRKYSFILDLIPTLLSGIFGSMIDGVKSKKGTGGRDGDRVVFVSGVSGYLKAREAMVKGHRSQMVWFRWGWIGLGRYMVLNDLKREHVVGL